VAGGKDIVVRARHVVATAAAVALCASCASSEPVLQSGAGAEVTHDGLHRVDNTTMDAAWMKPDLDLRDYTGLMVTGAGMSFRPADEGGVPSRRGTSGFPISEENRNRLREEMRKAFEEELSKLGRYELVEEPGPGVLLLSAGLIDVVSRVPPVDECAGRCEVYLTELGEATLVLELRDSVTNETLVRAVDRRGPDPSHMPRQADSVRSWSEVRQLARGWARLVRQRLEEFDRADQPAPTSDSRSDSRRDPPERTVMDSHPSSLVARADEGGGG
jgi:hypothetical protein